MDWNAWLQTIINAAIAGGIGYGQAWASGGSTRTATGSGIVAAGAVLSGLFQNSPRNK